VKTSRALQIRQAQKPGFTCKKNGRGALRSRARDAVSQGRRNSSQSTKGSCRRQEIQSTLKRGLRTHKKKGNVYKISIGWRVSRMQNPKTNKSSREQEAAHARNAFRGKEKPTESVLAGTSRCLGTYLAAYRGRFAMAASVDVSNTPQLCQLRKRIFRGGQAKG
jgi:hypothetical protein